MSIPKKILIIIITVLAVLSMMNSCIKQNNLQDAKIEILSPQENSFYALPDTIHAEVVVVSEEKPDYIRICVCNLEQTPVFTPVYFYPENLQTTLSFDYFLENMNIASEGQLYFQVTVTAETITNSFTKIQIEGKELTFKGFYLFTRPFVNETKIVLVNSQFTVENIATVSGNFETSDISAIHDVIYFISKTPDKLYAKQYEDEPFSWIIEPSADFPEFTSLCAEGNRVYCGYGNGKIAGFSDVSGQQLVSTPVLIDSIPEKLIVLDDYIVGDFRLKNKNSRSLSVFYKNTGARFQKAIHYTEVIDIYANNEQKELILFGNDDGKSVVNHYFFQGNYFNEGLEISTEPVVSSCRVGESVFLFCVNNIVFSIDLKTLIQKQLAVLSEGIISVKFDKTEQIVFVATSNDVYFYNYPSMQVLNTFYSDEPIKGIELRYAY